MHILTKILVVFAAVLSLGLAALTSSYAMNRDTITSSFNDMKAQRDKANSLYETQSSQFAEEKATLNSQIQTLQNELSQAQNANRDVESQLAELRLEARTASDRADSVTRQIADLGKTVDTQSKLITSMSEEQRKLREDAQRARERLIASLDRVNDLESQNEVLTQANRALQQSVVELQDIANNGGTATADAGTVGEPRTISGNLISGRVREVRSDNGQQYAEVDLGTRDRLRKNTKLHITRNGEFVANLIIVRTDLQTSVGRVDTIGDDTVQVRPGDVVLSSLTR
ncbi:MAG: hypothetical protein ED559_06865 [Phycisphaera sp.]|nr:MAG: hypothetical protein ED559_06865 [Phycisphaera sp.]